MIKLDSTRHSVVVVCTECAWRQVVPGAELAGAGRPAGWAAGAAHERLAHNGAGNAASAAYKAERRATGTG